MEDTAAARSIMASTEATSDGLLASLIATSFINVVFQGAMSQLLSFINSLQMLIHLPLLNIIMPANVSSFMQLLVPVVQFDILDSSWTTELIFEFDEDYLESTS